MNENPLHELTEFEQQLGALTVNPPSEDYLRKGKSLLAAQCSARKMPWQPFLTYALASVLMLSIGLNVAQLFNAKQTSTGGEITAQQTLDSEAFSFDTSILIAAQNDTVDGTTQVAYDRPRSAEQLYTQYCQVCHEQGIGGAPRTGHEQDWLPRITKGMDALVNNSVFSFSANTPCTDCTVDELESVIEYMVPTTIPRLVGQTVQYLADMVYQTLSVPVPNDGNTPEVQQLFWYGCYPCFDLQTQLAQWQHELNTTVEIKQTPAVWSAAMATHARAYYAALQFPNAADIHQALFSAISSAKHSYNDEAAIAPIFQQYGVSYENFAQAFHSADVDAQLDNSRRITQQLTKLGMRGVPGLIVNGKYLVNNTSLGEMIKVTDTLIQRKFQSARVAQCTEPQEQSGYCKS